MANKYDLGNMIFNLENKKDLKTVTFTQKAVIEVLGYLKELQCLELKLDRAKQDITNIQYQLSLTEKALELACEDRKMQICKKCINYQNASGIKLSCQLCGYTTESNIEQYFKQQAKEMMESE